MPVYSVATEAEAERLLTLTCGTNVEGQYYARELVEAQTIPNLEAFSERLHSAHKLLAAGGFCECPAQPDKER